MNYLSKIDDIINKLFINGDVDVAQEIQELKNSASNSSELLMTIAHRLNQLIKLNKEYRFIKSDVIELLNYCKLIGLKIY